MMAQPAFQALPRPAQGLNWVDMTLVVIFLIGIYLGVSIPITSSIPFPSAPSGLAGVVLLWRRRDRILPLHLAALLGVILVYVASILTATDYAFLGKRFTGLIQLTYSFVIGYALFLTVLEARRRQMAQLFFWMSVVIIIGCLLETYAGLDAVSDRVRAAIYESGVYISDRRDVILYGKVRPKFFTSEPSAVTFGYTLFIFCWFLVSAYRWKLLLYLGFIGIGMLVIPGPTLLLGLLLIPPYYYFIVPASQPPNRRSSVYRAGILIFGSILLIVFVLAGSFVYGERLNQIMHGSDPSFFFRVIGPFLVAVEVIKQFPWAGAGLTGENFINDLAINTYARSPQYSTDWGFLKLSDVITNFFWLHWIYLGAIWGVAVIAAISAWLYILRAPSIAFCWIVWIIFGQASGAYVGPKTWTVMLLPAALSVLYCLNAAATVVPLPEARRAVQTLRLGARLRQPGLASPR